MVVRCGVDTNVLLRLLHRDHYKHNLIATTMRRLVANDVELCFTPQNIEEFWNVSTRPVKRNGFGLSIQQTERHIRIIERTMTILPDNAAVYDLWRHILPMHDVRGIQVHDAHLAASLEAHGATHLLTFNGPDFKRFKAITAVSPETESDFTGLAQTK